MILPNNGKVVIFDDQISEVASLMAGLSHEKIPFVYFSDINGDDIPDQPIDNVRIIFLDLLLIDDNEPPVKKVISSLISRLRRTLSVNNGPYILIYWSTQRRKYGKALEMELSKRKLAPYKPFEILSLTKPSTLEKIKIELYNRFDKFKSLKAFFLFESIVNSAGGNIVNQFSNVFSVDGSWDKNLKDVLYKMGEARVGEENFKGLSDVNKIKNSLLTISSTMCEKINELIYDSSFSDIHFDPLAKYDTSLEAKAKFNTRLHLFKPIDSPIRSGNIYFVNRNKTLTSEILSKLKDPKKNIDDSKVKLLFIDLTPVCDYSQDKSYVRGVFGLLVKDVDKKLLKQPKPAFCKYSPLFFIEGEVFKLVLDFRYSDSILSGKFDERNWKPTFRISYELLAEFQAEYSKYINRPGFVSMY